MLLKNINEIKRLESPPKVISIFNKSEIKRLVELNKSLPITVFNKKQNVVKKRWIQNYDKTLDKLFLDKLKNILGEFRMDNLQSENGEDFFGLFQESFNPLKIHVDTGFDENNIVYKQSLVPLSEGETVIFQNKWYGGSTNFTIDKKEIAESNLMKNKGRNIRSSEHIDKYDKTDFNPEDHKKYLQHEDINNLKGLKILMVYKWKVGDILVWDRSHLHCSSSNIKDKKLGLTTFTKK